MIEMGYFLNIVGVRLVFGVYNFYMHSSESVRAEPAALCVKGTGREYIGIVIRQPNRTEAKRQSHSVCMVFFFFIFNSPVRLETNKMKLIN